MSKLYRLYIRRFKTVPYHDLNIYIRRFRTELISENVK